MKRRNSTGTIGKNNSAKSSESVTLEADIISVLEEKLRVKDADLELAAQIGLKLTEENSQQNEEIDALKSQLQNIEKENEELKNAISHLKPLVKRDDSLIQENAELKQELIESSEREGVAKQAEVLVRQRNSQLENKVRKLETENARLHEQLEEKESSYSMTLDGASKITDEEELVVRTSLTSHMPQKEESFKIALESRLHTSQAHSQEAEELISESRFSEHLVEKPLKPDWNEISGTFIKAFNKGNVNIYEVKKLEIQLEEHGLIAKNREKIDEKNKASKLMNCCDIVQKALDNGQINKKKAGRVSKITRKIKENMMSLVGRRQATKISHVSKELEKRESKVRVNIIQ